MRAISLLTVALSGAGLAQAQPCSPADVRGTYLFKTWGSHNLGPDHPLMPNTMGPTYGLGIVELDGAGKGSGRFTMSLGGVARTMEYVGLEYTVGENCAGTAQYRLKVVESESVWGPDKIEFQLLDDGARISGLMTDSGGRGAVLTSEFRRLSRGRRVCHQSMLLGTYSMHVEGSLNMRIFGPSQPVVFSPAFAVGRLIIDPHGAVSGAAFQNWGGIQIETELVKATLAVNPDCTGVYEYAAQIRGTPNQVSGRTSFVVSGDGALVTMLSVDPPLLMYYERVSIP